MLASTDTLGQTTGYPGVILAHDYCVLKSSSGRFIYEYQNSHCHIASGGFVMDNSNGLALARRIRVGTLVNIIP